MSTRTLRLLGIIFLFGAAVLAVLNLRRVEDLGLFWLVPPIMIAGLAFLALARRRENN